jgi:hypothetical protein
VSDATLQPPNQKGQKACIHFEKAVNAARKKQMGKEPEKFEMNPRAADSTSRSDDEEWSKQVNHLGDRLRGRKSPR